MRIMKRILSNQSTRFAKFRVNKAIASIVVAAIVSLSVSSAKAAEWALISFTEFGRISGYQVPGFGMIFHCKEGTQSRDPSFLEFSYGQDYAFGSYSFQIDDGTQLDIYFDGDPFVVDTVQKASEFNGLVQMLRRGNVLTVKDSAGYQSRISLAGSSAAIGPCVASSTQSSVPSDFVNDLESKIMDMPYGQARQEILASGWRVVANPSPDELVFVSRAMYDLGYVEVEVCAATGFAPCNFYFQKSENAFLRVMTSGEEPHVSGVQRLDAAGYREMRPLP